jgi:hypothetical protein
MTAAWVSVTVPRNDVVACAWTRSAPTHNKDAIAIARKGVLMERSPSLQKFGAGSAVGVCATALAVLLSEEW